MWRRYLLTAYIGKKYGNFFYSAFQLNMHDLLISKKAIFATTLMIISRGYDVQINVQCNKKKCLLHVPPFCLILRQRNNETKLALIIAVQQ